MSNSSLQNKVVVVAGASRGIGLEFVKQISATNNVIFAGARNPSQAKELQDLAKKCENVHPITLDICDDDSIKKAVEEVSQKAPQGIDVLINTAGIAGPLDNATQTTREDYMSTFNTNVVSIARNISFFLPLLQKRGKDHVKKILNISSEFGSLHHRETSGANNMAAYGVSKAALNMMTEIVANELKNDNFVVYLGHPGWVATDMGGKDAALQPQDSVRGLLKVLNDVTVKDNGKFYDWQGKEMKW
ncbi:hypothetical protein BDF20DRAFT_967463 [Mycotypha africana]|uniref:uncharacterized protein n=1 Tax=Mycotypha africana TaxID=64632 RepID=UPI002301DF7D|nr:uncharacterized protein BDF20DRAFT_967463 [Mycotypha africana]KAI8991375.1 hypothetical protein BDF20DRAFT_967463 [Mycotypha africana]